MRHFFLKTALLCFALIFSLPKPVFAASEPDWREGTLIQSPRANPYSFDATTLETNRQAGLHHTLHYPVDVSGSLIPWRAIENLLDHRTNDPLRFILASAFKEFSKIRSTDDLFARIGLHPYPVTETEGRLEVPAPPSDHPHARMGVTIQKIDGAEVFTVSCAACHTGNLFGKKIIGMTNRFPGANDFFVFGKKIVSLVPGPVFEATTGVTPEETRFYTRFRTRLRSVGARPPIADGLDTSLAQVALSLARRSGDEYATFDRSFERHPRDEPLSRIPADSKPAVWWNLKYKNRWLSDGSVVSGNPIYTNFLWNEIGRGTDLHELERWLDGNHKTIEELTTAVFATEAPKFTDFFPANRIDIERAKRGETLFVANCANCHGTYVKKWSAKDSESLPLLERLKTTDVRYFEETPVEDVGTDPLRWRGMKSLETGLNPLAISKKNGIFIRTQHGYVPPPLVGIWARFPYFHNNSAPSLCAVLTQAADRPVTYWAGESQDRQRDFDSACIGYPTGDNVPSAWRKKSGRLYDTRKVGMSRTGHDEGIFLKGGREIYTPAQKLDLIEFLKTL